MYGWTGSAALLRGQPPHLEVRRSDERLRSRLRRACPRPRGSPPGSADRCRSGTGCRSSTRRSSRRPGTGPTRAARPPPASGRAGSTRTARRCGGASVADRIDDRTGGALDRGDGLADRPLGRRLAGLCVAPVDQHRARRAEAGAAAELRAVQTEDVPEHPQQRVFACRSSTSTSAPLTTSFIELSLDRSRRALLHGRRVRPGTGRGSSPDGGDSRATHPRPARSSPSARAVADRLEGLVKREVGRTAPLSRSRRSPAAWPRDHSCSRRSSDRVCGARSRESP